MNSKKKARAVAADPSGHLVGSDNINVIPESAIEWCQSDITLTRETEQSGKSPESSDSGFNHVGGSGATRFGGSLGISTHKKTRIEKQPRIWGSESPNKPDVGWSLVEGVGMIVKGDREPGNPDAIGGRYVKRGKICGWSAASRKRMRRYLIDYGPDDQSELYGVTFTVPGVPPGEGCSTLTIEDFRKLWNRFAVWLRRQGWGLVWRIEIQQRGMPHYHCVVVVPGNVPAERFKCLVRDRWFYELDLLPEPYYVYQDNFISKDNKLVYRWLVWGRTCHTTSGTFSRSQWDGAEHRAVDVESDGGNSRWLRYLQDHATKCKQQQIGKNIGRHWGVVNRQVFRERPRFDLEAFDKKAYNYVRRMLRRLRSPVVRCPGAAARTEHRGQKIIPAWGYKVRLVPAGCASGERVVFGDCETYKRIIYSANMRRLDELGLLGNDVGGGDF